MKKIYCSLLLLSSLLLLQFSANVSFAQVPYTVSSISGQSYSPIAGGTVINTTAQLSPGQTRTADDGTVLVALPFSFDYAGQNFSQVTFCTNGWIALGDYTWVGATPSRSGTNLFSSIAPNNTIAAWYKDGSANFPAPYGIGSMVHGMVDTGVYAFQWSNAAGSGYSLTTANTISCMIKLYGPSSSNPGRIELLYGPKNGTFSANAAIGLDDTSGHYLNAVNGQTNANITSSAWPGDGNGYRFDPWQPCSGTPVGGMTMTSADSICSAKPFMLTIANASTGTGLAYQWQSSADTSTWTDVSGQTASSYTVSVGINQGTWFRRALTCNGNTSYSDPVYVSQKDPSLCYCTTGSSGTALHSPTGAPTIDSVSIAGTSLNNPSSGYAPGGLTQYPASGNTTASLTKGATYSLSVRLSSTGDAAVWVDWNRNGQFESSEWKLVNSRASNGAINFTVPVSAMAGVTGLRVRSRATGNGVDSANACVIFGSGETEDYLVTVVDAQPCTGTPSGVSITGSTQVCSGQSFTLMAGGFTFASGLGFQWQSSPAGQSNWTDITGATVNTATLSQASATDYRVVLTCNNSNPIISDSLSVAMKTTGCPPVNDEPCNAINLPVSADTNCVNKRVGTTALATTSRGYGYNNPIGCSIGYSPKDVWYKVTTDSTGAGSTGLYFRLARAANSTMTTASMILFSASGNCPQPTLTYQGACKNSTAGFYPYLMKASNLQPNTTYYLRISPCADNDPTGDFEVCAYIPPPTPPCVVKVYPAPMDTVPYNQVVTFKWKPSPGATEYDFYMGDTYPPMYYSTSTDTTETKTFFAYNRKYYWQIVPNNIYGSTALCSIDSFVTEMPPANCIPMTSSGCTYGDSIKLFTLVGEDSTFINRSSGCSAGGYSDYTPGARVTLYPGNAYAGTFITGDQTNYVTIWIDFDNDGFFRDEERLLNHLRVSGKDSVTPYGINIPSSAAIGNHRMRVRNVYWSYLNVHATDPCNFFTFSETEDYTVKIDTPATGHRPYVSRAMNNNCMTLASLTVDDSTNNSSRFINIVDEHNQLVASINANGNNLGYVDAIVYKNAGPVRTTPAGIKLLDRNITITPQYQPVSPVTVRLYFTDDELAALRNADPMISDRSDIAVTKTDATCSTTALPVNGTAVRQSSSGAYGSDHYVEVTVTGFSTFYLNRDAAILPVTITSFTGENRGSINVLNWRTATELNSAGFDLERSVDGVNFSRLAFVPSMAKEGNSTAELRYTYNDERPLRGNGYYRLKQLDKDGRYRYSNVVLIKGGKVSEIMISSLYPNPVKQAVNLVITSPASDKVTIFITDITGRIIRQQAAQVIAGDNLLTIDAGNLQSGTYFVSTTCANGCKTGTIKFVKE